MNRKLYAAYGSNMNIPQMQRRCRDAILVGTGDIENYELEFRYFANITKSFGHEVPVVIWSISEEDERNLDIYEGVSSGLYRKETVRVKMERLNDKVDLICGGVYVDEVYAMAYIMNENKDRPIQAPSRSYYEIVRAGYLQNGIEIYPLSVAAIKSHAKFAPDEDEFIDVKRFELK